MKTKVLYSIWWNVIGIIILSTNVQSQSWIGLHHDGGSAVDGADAISIDSTGKIFIAGLGQGVMTFDSIIVQCKGAGDCIVSRYDASLNPVWVRRGGGYDPIWSDYGTGLFVDHDGNIYVVGCYQGIAEFNSITVTPYGQYDIFIAKYDNDGNCLWVKTAGGPGQDFCTSVVFDGSGNFYLTGMISWTAVFDTITVPNTSTDNILFLAKYNMGGTCEWVVTPSGTGVSDGSAVAYCNDRVYMTANYTGTISLGIHQVTSISSYRHLVAQFDPAGNCLWVETVQGTGTSYALSAIADYSGNCILTGTFQGSLTIGPDSVTSAQNWDIFLSKYNRDGTFQWIQQAHASTGSDYSVGSKGRGLSTFPTGDVLLTGQFCGTINWGVYSVTGTSWEDLFVAKFDSSGECLGTGHGTNSIGGGIAITPDGLLMVCGSMHDTAIYDSQIIVSYGEQDILLAKLTDITGSESLSFEKNEDLVIYANPNEGRCTIIIPDEFLNNDNLTLLVYDNKGTVIQSVPVRFTEDHISINIAAQARGIYQVILTDGQQQYSGKIVFTE